MGSYLSSFPGSDGFSYPDDWRPFCRSLVTDSPSSAPSFSPSLSPTTSPTFLPFVGIPPSQERDNTLLIAGVSVGMVVLCVFLVVVAAAIFVWKRRNSDKKTPQSSDSLSPPAVVRQESGIYAQGISQDLRNQEVCVVYNHFLFFTFRLLGFF